MKQIDWTPFADWAIEALSSWQCDNIRMCIRYDDIEGLWGYLLRYFDSVKISLSVYENNLGFVFVRYNEYEFCADFYATRPEAQIKAVIKAFDIIKNV